MSKQREPEVGDVFEYHNTRYIITEINNMGYIYIFRPKDQPEFISQTSMIYLRRRMKNDKSRTDMG